MTKSYITKTGQARVKPSLSWVTQAAERQDGAGWCFGCGKTATHCDPDGRKYTCGKCGKPLVYGAEEIGLMGLYHI